MKKLNIYEKTWIFLAVKQLVMADHPYNLVDDDDFVDIL